MIVLDDQLSAPYLKSEIEEWYAAVVFRALVDYF